MADTTLCTHEGVSGAAAVEGRRPLLADFEFVPPQQKLANVSHLLLLWRHQLVQSRKNVKQKRSQPEKKAEG